MTSAAPAGQPLYARALRLRHIHPSGLWCFVFLEGMIALGVLLALAELASWWAVLVLPAVVAAMVKVNDVVAGALAAGPRQPAPPGSLAPSGAPPASEPEAVDPPAAPGDPAVPPRESRQVSRDLADTMDPVDSPRQRFRQSAHRRYR